MTEPKITINQFKYAFLSMIYREAINTTSDFSLALKSKFLEAVKFASDEKELILRYKRYSQTYFIKVRIRAYGPYLTLIPEHPSLFSNLVQGGIPVKKTMILASPEPILKFYSIPTLEQAKKQLNKKLKFHSWTLLYEECASNDETLKEIIHLVETLQNASYKLRDEAIVELITELQTRFEFESGLNLDNIAEHYFDYVPAHFYNYLVLNGLKGIPSLDKFPIKSNKNSINFPSAFPCHGWEIERKSDGYGHECGTAVEINWISRSISTIGFSTDD